MDANRVSEEFERHTEQELIETLGESIAEHVVAREKERDQEERSLFFSAFTWTVTVAIILVIMGAGLGLLAGVAALAYRWLAGG